MSRLAAALSLRCGTEIAVTRYLRGAFVLPGGAPPGCNVKGYSVENSIHGGEYAPHGEESGVQDSFGLEQIARAFEVEPERVQRAMLGEFGSDQQHVDSKQAQHLAEVLIGDQPQDHQMAALMRLGAFTPRTDHAEGIGEKDPDEESDKLAETVEERKEGLGQPLMDERVEE